MTADEERIALFLDYENLAIGARDDLGGAAFDLKPVADALAERGRVVVRRAYADWSYFDDDRRMLTIQHVELIEIPQRLGTVRKNAADIKLAVDAIELCFERDYITTFVICTGDSDFTPLVGKLRELNRRVIGVGLQASTSRLLPPACDEFLFYERLEGVEVPQRRRRDDGRDARRQARPAASAGATSEGNGRPDRGEPEDVEDGAAPPADISSLGKLVTQTLSGLQRTTGGAVLASSLKRAILRKDPTFSEADYGFRAFGELLRHLGDRGVVELAPGTARGDPEVGFPERSGDDESDAFELLRDVVADLERSSGPPPLSGLKNQLRKRRPGFSEKEFGFGGFLQFCKAAQTRGIVRMEWREEADDYVFHTVEPDAEQAASG
ncbi:MAG: NYN domain-containing protein [Nitriliruptorales bacterium]|nr:NYN domain-containing protein [Nitriliruptorales bacterium]